MTVPDAFFFREDTPGRLLRASGNFGSLPEALRSASPQTRHEMNSRPHGASALLASPIRFSTCLESALIQG
jgi:hypothetical protein